MEWSGEFCFGEMLAAYVGFAAHMLPTDMPPIKSWSPTNPSWWRWLEAFR